MLHVHTFRYYIIRALLGIWFLLCVVWLSNWMASWPSHQPDEKLLAPIASYPTEWETPTGRFGSVDWVEGTLTFFGVTDARLFGSWVGRSETGLSYQQKGSEGPPYISQFLGQYSSPIEAVLKLWQVQPGDFTAWHDLHFSPSVNQPTLEPPLELFRTPYASDRKIRCAVGPVTNCELWYAWIRYGQYILQINVIIPQHGMSYTTFASFVSTVDQHVGQALRRPQ